MTAAGWAGASAYEIESGKAAAELEKVAKRRKEIMAMPLFLIRTNSGGCDRCLQSGRVCKSNREGRIGGRDRLAAGNEASEELLQTYLTILVLLVVL